MINQAKEEIAKKKRILDEAKKFNEMLEDFFDLQDMEEEDEDKEEEK